MTGPIPAAAWLRAYEHAWLRSDLVAGLTAAAVVIPQAMAYADIAGLPLAVGLYTALVPLVVYAVMGTSRPLSVTTTSTLAILTAGALHAIAPPGANDSVLISATATLAFLVGGILLVASILRLWIVASFISEDNMTTNEAMVLIKHGGRRCTKYIAGESSMIKVRKATWT